MTISAGDKVVMWHVAANRDPRAFADPWKFDVERSPNDHVGFGGGGPHFCLGANLARMEIRLMFRGLARRMPDIRPAGHPSYLRSNFIGGVKRLPVAFTPSPSLNTAALARLARRRGRRAPSASAATWSARSDGVRLAGLGVSRNQPETGEPAGASAGISRRRESRPCRSGEAPTWAGASAGDEAESAGRPAQIQAGDLAEVVAVHLVGRRGVGHDGEAPQPRAHGRAGRSPHAA